MNNEDLVRQAKADYMRTYRANNKEKIRVINQRYWLNKSIEAMKDQGEINR
jgi:hypothetical protein